VAVTIPVGEISSEAQRLISVTREALEAGIAAARIGNRLGDISEAIERTVRRAGFFVIEELTGHGIGKSLHEPPQVFNIGRGGEGMTLREGMVIAIEPITAISTNHVRLAKDGFGYETDDGSLAAHFEHTVAITSKGPEILTTPLIPFPSSL
jgi:methionyl aminopeptidase